jgi:hypothetical protein
MPGANDWLKFVIARLVAEMDCISRISMREISPRDSDPEVGREYCAKPALFRNCFGGLHVNL